MRILLYVYEIYPLGGGVGRAVKALLDRFAQYEDIQIDCVTSSLTGKFEIEKFSDNISIHRIPIGKRKESDYHKQRPLQMALYSFLAFLYTWKLVFTRKYTVAHFFGYPGGLVTLLFRWKLRYIISLRGVDVPGYNPKFMLQYILFYTNLSRLIWFFADYVIANSTQLSKLAQKTYPKKHIMVIPNGIDTHLYDASEDRKRFEKFTVSAGGTIMGKLKGLDYLIRGFAKFAEGKDVQLMLYGSGVQEEELRELVATLGIPDKVVFRGRVEHEVIEEELPKCHLFCLPSLNEGMSNAALEGLASGLPLLLTDTGGRAELIDEGINGILIKKKDSEDIAEKLQMLYEDESLRERMGRASRKKAEAMSWGSVAQQYKRIYDKYKD